MPSDAVKLYGSDEFKGLVADITKAKPTIVESFVKQLRQHHRA